MQSVLVYSRHKGETGWIPAPNDSAVRVKGMKEGDLLRISYRPIRSEISGCIWVSGNGFYSIPMDTTHIQVGHEKCSGSRVSVDLVEAIHNESSG